MEILNISQLLKAFGFEPAEVESGPLPDTSEKVCISPMALLKMLRHAKSGVPFEVMGLMLGSFVDHYTVHVVDVFSMPQSGTVVSVESVDHVFQTKMLGMLSQVGRREMVVGWYHSHPGYGCWLSDVDMNTQMSFEKLSKRCVAVVIDPVQSVGGKVIIDAFRLIPGITLMPGFTILGDDTREITSTLGHLSKPPTISLMRGLNKLYYSLIIVFTTSELDQHMLQNVYTERWHQGLCLQNFSDQCKLNEQSTKEMVSLTNSYYKRIEEEMDLTPGSAVVKYTGKRNPKRHLEEQAESSMSSNLTQILKSELNLQVLKTTKDI